MVVVRWINSGSWGPLAREGEKMRRKDQARH